METKAEQEIKRLILEKCPYITEDVLNLIATYVKIQNNKQFSNEVKKVR